MFRLRARDSELSGKFKPGSYALATGMPYELVFEKLAAGPEIVYFDVTIPEGYTATRVAARIAKETGIPRRGADRARHHRSARVRRATPVSGRSRRAVRSRASSSRRRIASREGASARSVVEMMLDQFDEEIAKVDLSYAKSKNLTVTDVVIIASILERETQLSKEYPLVASVIYNRLRRQDATAAGLDGVLHAARGHQGPQEGRPESGDTLQHLPARAGCLPDRSAIPDSRRSRPRRILPRPSTCSTY